jgi:hypothetical protein
MGKQCFGAPVGRREEKGEDVDIPTEKREVGSGPGNRRDGRDQGLASSLDTDIHGRGKFDLSRVTTEGNQVTYRVRVTVVVSRCGLVASHPSRVHVI